MQVDYASIFGSWTAIQSHTRQGLSAIGRLTNKQNSMQEENTK